MTTVVVGWPDRPPPEPMTLGEALEYLNTEPIGCACPEPPGSPWCCYARDREAFALKRAAHIVVKLLDHARRMR